MTFIVARHSPQAGLIEPLPAMYSCHNMARGIEIGIKERYETREEAAADAERLERLISDPACQYRATLLSDA